MPKTEAEFMEYFRGVDARLLRYACTHACSGISYDRCSKKVMAEAWVRDSYGIGKVPLEAIAAQLAKIWWNSLYAIDARVSLGEWLIKRGMVAEKMTNLTDLARKYIRD